MFVGLLVCWLFVSLLFVCLSVCLLFAVFCKPKTIMRPVLTHPLIRQAGTEGILQSRRRPSVFLSTSYQLVQFGRFIPLFHGVSYIPENLFWDTTNDTTS